MLRTPKVLSQVQCFGEDIRVQPFYIEIITRFFPDIEPSQQAIQHLANIYRDRKLTDNIDSWTVEAKRHRDALIAIDLVHRGYPYQVVARVIHGDKFVEEEWNNPNRTLKNRTIRSFKRGIRMMHGGFSSLLT